MKKLKWIGAFVLIVFAYNSFAQTITLTKAAYSIKYPSTWEVKPGANNLTFNIQAPSDGAGDTYTEFIDLTVNKLEDATMNAEKYALFSKGYLPSKIPKFKVVESKKTTQNKVGYFMVFTGLQNGKQCKWKQCYFVKNSKVYIITYTAAAESYDSYKAIVEPMIASFIVK
jgi:hypothetical protein